jgi:elongation factor Ts
VTAPTISASLVKELREQTGVGMMDCKRALEETGGDVEAARTLLRERGMASAAKRAGREVTEGLVGYRIADGRGTMVGVGCETEPVSKNDEFQAFAKKALDAAHEQGVEALEQLEDERIDLVAKLGENIVIAGKARFQAEEGQIVEGYVHPPANKLGVLVLLRGGDDAFAKKVAMHIAAGTPAPPEWIGREEVPADAVTTEREIYANSDEVLTKPEQAREKIVDGMLKKHFFAARVLTEQPWIHDDKKTVGQALADEGAEVLEFERIALSG